ncbi:LamG domain-containing protein [Paenibacillus hemerocallicola]|uniref:LamG domain-containing protein n=1 Tax=Paenibacillus hemerocallicola TaxID=1172614 RepID=A0A5C4SYF6_9BACL|nr:LamG domain-containing protein [Paenibacillus hemerocallicola]TNJ58380.1 LamG domain-containing protein [Paenibacillus hemerocallicola]
MENKEWLSMTEKATRIGYWPLRTNTDDVTEHRRHGVGQAVTFNKEGAVFDGIGSAVSLPVTEETNGSRPFSLSLQFQVKDGKGFLPGGLASVYTVEKMEGWHLSVLTQAGVTSTQSNWRNLQFGWSTAKGEDVWRDWGSPGNGRMISALCVHDGHLYAGTFDNAVDNRGRVFRLDNATGEWMDCGYPDDSNSVYAFAEFKGHLYAGTMRYRAGGSSLPDSPNIEPGGRVYRYKGGQEWELFGELPVPDNDSVGALTVYDDRLIAMSFYPHGVFAYDEHGNCKPLGAPGPAGNIRTFNLAPHQGDLYIGCNSSGGVYRRKLDEPWTYCGNVPTCSQVYCFSTFHNRLLMGIWHEARMLRYEGGTEWSDYGLMDEELEVMGVSVFNGKLYGGTLPGGFVYRYNGERNWEKIAVLEEPDPNIRYRRVWSMAVYNGKLFAGTLPSGKVWSLSRDPLATHDTSLADGWHRAVVTYDRSKLELYVDGALVSEAACDAGTIDSAALAGLPLTLGKGPQCHFSGVIREVELFAGVLTADEAARLSGKGAGA